MDVDRIDLQYGYCTEENCDVPTREWEVGTLVLDLVDSRTNLVVWRGWAQNSVQPMLENRDRMAETINKAVERMLERFPRSVTGSVNH
jgi:hypothetical protein